MPKWNNFNILDPLKTEQLSNATTNRLQIADFAVHDWYRFVLSFPPHLVRTYLKKFRVPPNGRILDPFCGTGTTLVECKKHGFNVTGVEAHPMAHFASKVKTTWTPDPNVLLSEAHDIAAEACSALGASGILDEPLNDRWPRNLRRLSSEQNDLLLENSISALPMHKALVLLDLIKGANLAVRDHLRLALAASAVSDFSNLHFGPEVGVSKPKRDAAVILPWLERVEKMAADLQVVKQRAGAASLAIHADARELSGLIPSESIDAVITSPPYPNEKDYTRTTRLEAVLLGFVANKAELRLVKQGLLRSNTRNVYKADIDDRYVQSHSDIQIIADAIEAKRIELNKTSGFERLYARVTKLYFGGMARHFEDLKAVLAPGAKLAYVVGDQASYLRVMIRTGQLLAAVAKHHGFKPLAIDLFRTRLATATREQLREEVVVLEYPKRTRRRHSALQRALPL